MEEISAACASCGVIMSVNNSLFCDPIYKFGTDAQKKEVLAECAAGKKLGCFGLTEPMSGSDAQHMATRAEKKGSRYVLRGQKNFITNGPHADAIVVFAATDPAAGAKGTTCFVIPKEAKGYVIGPFDKKLGIRGSLRARTRSPRSSSSKRRNRMPFRGRENMRQISAEWTSS